MTTSPRILRGFDVKVFGLFQSWLYTTPHVDGLVNKHGDLPYQDRCMRLWVLGKRLALPDLQNDSIDVLELQRWQEQIVHTNALDFVYDNTSKGDPLRSYLTHTCARAMNTFHDSTLEDRLPPELLRDIEEARFFKIEEEENSDGVADIETSAYHVKLS